MENKLMPKEIVERLIQEFSKISRNLIVTLHKDLLSVKMSENESMKITNAAHKRLDKSLKKIEAIFTNIFERMGGMLDKQDFKSTLEVLDQNVLKVYISALRNLSELENSNRKLENLLGDSQACVESLKNLNSRLIAFEPHDIFQEFSKSVGEVEWLL